MLFRPEVWNVGRKQYSQVQTRPEVWHPDVAETLSTKYFHYHRRKTFLEEYVELLKEFEIEYDERYLFKPLA